MVCKYPVWRMHTILSMYLYSLLFLCVSPPPPQSNLDWSMWGVVSAPLHSAAQCGTTLLLQQTVGVNRFCWDTSLWSKTSDTQAEDKKGQPSACDGQQHMVVEGPPSTVTKVPSGRFDSGFVQKDYYWEQTVNAVREAWWDDAKGSRTEVGSTDVGHNPGFTVLLVVEVLAGVELCHQVLLLPIGFLQPPNRLL